jgi:hypothetical protein
MLPCDVGVGGNQADGRYVVHIENISLGFNHLGIKIESKQLTLEARR